MSGEELSHEVYKWLATLDVVPTNLKYKSNGNFQLDSKTSEGLINGFLIAKLLVQLANQHSGTVNLPLLSSVKHSNTPAARVYNWNILAQSFQKINVTVTKQTQKEITSGNFTTMVRFLLELHKKFNKQKERKDEDSGNSDINLKRLQIMQSFTEAESFLEMVVMIISESLNLTPKQAVSTLSQSAKYYAHMVVKGVKNSFVEIISMLEIFTKQMSKLMYQCEKSPQKNTQFFLDLIKPTLISRDADVARQGALLFKCFIDQSLKYNSKNLIYQILCKQNVGFDFLYMGLKRHPDLIGQFSTFLYPLIGDAFKDFFEVNLKRTINNQQQYLKIVIKLLEGLTSNQQSKTKLKDSGLLEIWLKSSEQSFNNKKNKEQNLINQQTKILYLELLCNLWKDYAHQINEEQAEELLMKGIQQLKKNARRDIYTIKIPAMLRLFDFLHFLADAKNKVAPILYKKLIFLFIENHSQQQIRELFLANFTVMIKKYPTIPIQFLLQPFLRQLINSEGKTYILNVFDFQFMIQLCKHTRMDAENGLSYLQFLSKLYVKSFIYSKLTIRVIQILTSRFCQEETIVQFLKKNVQSTLNLYGILMFGKKKLNKEDAIINKQKKSLAIELIKHFIGLEHGELSKFILQKITGFYMDWLEEKRYSDKGLHYLMSLYGDVDEICLNYKISISRQYQSQQLGERQQTGQGYSNQSNSDDISKPTPKSEAYRQHEYMKEKGMGYKMSLKTSKTRVEQMLERRQLKPSAYVLKDIEKLKQKMKDQAQKKKQHQRDQLKRISQKNNQNSIELLQRNLSLGYAKLTAVQDDRILFDFDSVKVKQLKLSTKFHELGQLQQIDEKSANVVLKQYAKEIKSLFLKYALISSSNDRKSQASTMMSFTEVVKMLKQKNLSGVNKLMASDLIASINYSKRKEKNVLSGIQQSQFNQFLVKLTDYTIQQDKSAAQMPFGLKLQQVLKTLFHGESFYQNKFRVKQDPKISKLKQILNGPNQFQQVDIPQVQLSILQGYKKVKQNHIDLQFKICQNDWNVEKHYQACYEVADWLINKCLGLHVMTPKVQINQRYNLIQVPKPIKPKLQKNQTDSLIKYEPTGEEQLGNDVMIGNDLQIPKQDRERKKSQKGQRPKDKTAQKRSISQRAIKTKTDPIESIEQQKQKLLKRQKYVAKLKQNMQRLRAQKQKKDQQQKARKQQQKAQQKKKEDERKRYLQNNKQKIKLQKLKEQQQKQQKEEETKQEKQMMKQENRRKEQQMNQRHQDDIRKRADKANERKKELEQSKDKKAQIYQKLAKQVTNNKAETQADKLKMMEIKNSLQLGDLRNVVSIYEKQLNTLFQNYWVWDKKRIQLNGIALILKDLHITPEYILPKDLADTYKGVGKGQNLDFEGFLQCLAKCSFRSQKLSEQVKAKQTKQVKQGIDDSVFRLLLSKMRMNQPNYKQVIKNVKNHLV